MKFRIVPPNQPAPKTGRSEAHLLPDDWDDWGKYQTLHHLYIFDHQGERHEIGRVKIGEAGLAPGKETGTQGFRSPALPSEFGALNETFFSLGQSERYYESLNLLPRELSTAILRDLRDVAFDLSLFEQFENEDVMRESLLRSIRASNVRNRLHRLSHGDATLTRFHFGYSLEPTPSRTEDPPYLTFSVVPDSAPSTNVHVLIGRNGVGKTRLLHRMVRSLVGRSTSQVDQLVSAAGSWDFSGLVLIGFSAFDSFEEPDPGSPMPIEYVGLRHWSEGKPATKSPGELTQDFIASFELCREGIRAERWKQAVATLSSDPGFAEVHVESLLHDPDWKTSASSTFGALSSGHKVVLLSLTKLVELVEEKTLVLLDEPESHLHPPLLSAYLRSLSKLLFRHNAVAIIATHSPVVLQEVPRSCVWMLRRSGQVAHAERPSIETFGENVGVLTREVFGLEVTDSGFHTLLQSQVRLGANTFEELIDHFGRQLGAEGLAIARALVSTSRTPER